MALHWRRNLQHRSAISNSQDKLSTLNRATVQDNATLSKAGSNFGLPAPNLSVLGLGLSALINFQPFIKTFIEIDKN